MIHVLLPLSFFKLHVRNSIRWSVVRSVSQLVGWSVDRSVGSSVGPLVPQMVCHTGKVTGPSAKLRSPQRIYGAPSEFLGLGKIYGALNNCMSPSQPKGPKGRLSKNIRFLVTTWSSCKTTKLKAYHPNQCKTHKLPHE